MTLFCPKCGSIAETDTAGGIICSNSSCNWSGCIDTINQTQVGSIHLERVEDIEKKAIEKNPDSNLRYYYVEYKEGDDELFQADDVYSLIEKRLKQEGEFSSFVERCYKSFRDSAISEIVQFYNHFSEYTIEKISGFDNLTVVYEKK